MVTFLVGLTPVLLAAQTYSIQTLAGTNAPAENVAAVQAPFASIEGVAVDGAGNVYVADAGDHRVRRITPSGVVQTIAGDGVAGVRGDGGPARTARLNSPYGLALDRMGNLYIADLGNGRVRRVGTDGVITTVAGGGLSELPAGQTAVRGVEAKLKSPRNVLVDGQGQVWITDFEDSRLLRLTAEGWLWTAASVGLRNPTAMALDRAGTLYVADAGNARIVKWLGGQLVPATSTGEFSTRVLFYAVTGLAIDGDGNLFAMEGGVRNLRRISPRNEIVEYGWAGRDVAVDAQRRIFLGGGGTVRRMSSSGVEVIAGGGDFRYAGDQGAAEQARLNAPSAVAMDGSGNVWIADTLNHRIRRVAAVGGAITTIAGTGEPGYAGDGGLAVQARLRSPSGIAVDERGYVYFSDTGNHAVRRITPGGMVESVVGNGAPGRTFTQMNRPMGMAFDAQGTLIVADSENGRIVQAGIGNTLRVLAQSAEGVGLKRPVDVAVDPAGRAVFIADPGAKALFRLTSARLETVENDRLFEPTAVAVDP
ncbi:MAG: SMP-30/gluconolactonase/LRE family protein, partial [Bryobacteraceae bacterium]|nr:SMP-30/gluconolactonase/LRE family protein [Bryobacteraceae bacterium]